ncbi:hypothetical protein [Salinisphaera orenii]|uniref:hypothetical protein n=1 Tax=Salinisphaera orenii TaxID=856731 RepID=UPI00296F2B7F
MDARRIPGRNMGQAVSLNTTSARFERFGQLQNVAPDTGHRGRQRQAVEQDAHISGARREYYQGARQRDSWVPWLDWFA